jgi:hypothetical protein
MALLIDRNSPETQALLAGPRDELLHLARGLRNQLPRADLVILDGPAERPAPPTYPRERRPSPQAR